MYIFRILLQVFQVGQALVKYTKIRIALVCGGLNSKLQEKELLTRPDIIIATPGRLMSFIKDLPGFTLQHVEVSSEKCTSVATVSSFID